MYFIYLPWDYYNKKTMIVPLHDVTLGQTGKNSDTIMRVPQSQNTATMGQFMRVPLPHGTAPMILSDHESTTVTWYCSNGIVRS